MAFEEVSKNVRWLRHNGLEYYDRECWDQSQYGIMRKLIAANPGVVKSDDKENCIKT